MITANVDATPRPDRPEGDDTRHGPARRHRRSQGPTTRESGPARPERPMPAAREWFATTANAAPAGYVAWFRHPEDGALSSEPVAGLLTQHLHEVDALGYRKTSRGSLDTRVVPAVFDPEGGVTAVDEAPGFLAVTPAAVTAEQIERQYPHEGAA